MTKQSSSKQLLSCICISIFSTVIVLCGCIYGWCGLCSAKSFREICVAGPPWLPRGIDMASDFSFRQYVFCVIKRQATTTNTHTAGVGLWSGNYFSGHCHYFRSYFAPLSDRIKCEDGIIFPVARKWGYLCRMRIWYVIVVFGPNKYITIMANNNSPK